MRRQRVMRVAVACGVMVALTAPTRAQEIRVRVKVDPVVVEDMKAAIKDAINSDLGREISDAIRDAARETRRTIPELARLADAAAAGWQDRNFRFEQKDTETKTLQLGATGSLELKNVSGNITVTAGSGRDTTVQIVRTSKGRTDADAKLGLERVKVEVDARGDRATVDAKYPSENRPPYSVSTDYTVTAPAGTRLTVRSISGNSTVKGITGDVAVDVTSGEVRITDGNVSSVTAISGDVQITNATVNGSMNLSTVSGTLTLDQIKCRRLSGSVISGEVHAKDITCDNAELKSLSGSVDYTGSLARSGRYELQTHSGNVHVTVTGSVGFELQASTFSGEVRLDPPLQLQRSTLTRKSARGTVGDGSAVVTATAFSGNVVITKK
ncbi:MAG TPA: DUF4097 family beta strand repeat-containing protein [Vicinamibacterales bacterium]|nr:DUF4097 family beta strand repeat-containing protein [Vicinamibacterales bacterium]